MKTIRILSAILLLASLVVIGSLSQSASAGAILSPSQPSLTQYFQDVPVGSFWYNYTASLYQEGITTGFPCTPNPPYQCVPPNNLPYFDPNLSITRGQTAAFFSRSLAPGIYITGSYTGTNGQRGVFNATNTNLNDNFNAGLYGKGPHGVAGIADSNGTQNSAGGYFSNPITYTTVSNYGIYATAANGVGVYGESDGSTSGQDSAGVHGHSSTGEGGKFDGNSGIVSNGHSATQSAAGDGLDVGGAGGSYDAIYSTQPSGDANWTLFGNAHIHGSNVSAAGYEVEVRYDGSAPAQIGDVLAVDGNNGMDGGTAVLGVTKADSHNINAAIGVLSYRLSSVKVNGQDKPVIDAAASSITAGDYAYLTVIGQARMKLAGATSIGDRVSLAGNGSPTVATKDSDIISVGKVVSQPDANGYVTVFVNMK